MWFGNRISSPIHLTTVTIPIQNQKCLKNAKTHPIFPLPFEVQPRLCRLYKCIHRQPKPNLCLPALLSKHHGRTVETSQELRMLSSVTINCQVRMIVWIQVLNCQNCNQCLKCQVSRTVFPIVKNCLNVIKYCHQKIVIKNCHRKLSSKSVIKKCHQVPKVLKVLKVL